VSDEEAPRDPSGAPRSYRKALGVVLLACLLLLGLRLVADRPWVSDHDRVERCSKLRHDRVRVLPSTDPDSRYSREDLKAFCRIDAANNNLNHKGGLKHLV
jgi:hypothetical protein